MTAPDQPFQDFEFAHSNRGIHTYLMLIIILRSRICRHDGFSRPASMLAKPTMAVAVASIAGKPPIW